MTAKWKSWMHPYRLDKPTQKRTRIVRWGKHIAWMLTCGHVRAGRFKVRGTWGFRSWYFQNETVWEIYCGRLWIEVSG
jgi:hypothetical protein